MRQFTLVHCRLHALSKKKAMIINYFRWFGNYDMNLQSYLIRFSCSVIQDVTMERHKVALFTIRNHTASVNYIIAIHSLNVCDPIKNTAAGLVRLIVSL